MKGSCYVGSNRVDRARWADIRTLEVVEDLTPNNDGDNDCDHREPEKEAARHDTLRFPEGHPLRRDGTRCPPAVWAEGLLCAHSSANTNRLAGAPPS